jgi:hypothetical protein
MHSGRHDSFRAIGLIAAWAISSHALAVTTGGDRSAQRCIASAGYSWSQLRQECLRVFEAGVPLYNAQDPRATSVAHVIGGGAMEPLELFLPDQVTGMLMFFRDGAWRDDDGRYSLSNDENDVLTVRDRQGNLLYSSRKRPETD